MLSDVYKDVEQRMEQTVEHLKQELAKIRTGRASLIIFDSVKVPYYGTPTPLNQVAKLSVPEASLILIQPYDPGIIGEIEKAIQSSDLGLNPANDGKVIRVPIPPLTQERRTTLSRHVHALGEETKNAVRHVRRDGNDVMVRLEKDKQVSKDDAHRGKEEIQKKTDDWCKKVDELVSRKDKELMEV